MPNSPNARTVAALQKMIIEIQYLVDHPRMQQRNWVAKGRTWLPILQHAIEDLSSALGVSVSAPETHNPINQMAILVKVNVANDETYLNIDLEDVREVNVYRGGEPGHRYVRGAHSDLHLRMAKSI
jgi:hypothetical protein